MRIQRLVLDQIGCFDHLDIAFQKGRDPNKADIHLLVGANGTGKSTLLMAMAQFFSPFSTGVLDRFRSASYIGLTADEQNFVATNWTPDISHCPPTRAPTLVPGVNAPWESALPVPVSPYWDAIENSRELVMFEGDSAAGVLSFRAYRRAVLDLTAAKAARGDKKDRLAFAAFLYESARSLGQFFLTGISEIDDISLADACSGHTDPRRNRSQVLMQWSANTAAKAAFAGERADFDARLRYRDSIDRIQQIIAQITGRQFAFVISHEPIGVSVSLDGSELPVDVLPDGLKSLISWIGDLLMRLDRIPWVDDTPVLDRNLVLFLDEIEVHLHPAWQRKILPVVQDLLPNAQVFVSTHSPFVIASADDAWIYPLYLDKQGHGHLGEVLPSMVGNSYATVLRDVLGIEAEFAPQVDEELMDFYALRDRALRGDARALQQLKAKGAELGRFGEEVLAIVRPELRQVERRLGGQPSALAE